MPRSVWMETPAPMVSSLRRNRETSASMVFGETSSLSP